ncbi:hypothetical protein BHM03_00036206, partial [Ensete ventricosum]
MTLAGLEGELLLVHGLRVELRERISGSAEGGIQRPIGLIEPRRLRFPLPRHRSNREARRRVGDRSPPTPLYETSIRLTDANPNPNPNAKQENETKLIALYKLWRHVRAPHPSFPGSFNGVFGSPSPPSPTRSNK